MNIADFKIGSKPFIIAELSGNHDGDIEYFKQLLKATVATGVDAVKVQHYKPSSLTLPGKQEFFISDSPLWKGTSFWDLYSQGAMPWEWTQELKAYAEELGTILFSSPFCLEGVDFLEKEMDPPAYKIASYEVIHEPLLKRIAQTGKPVVMSTGMASMEDIDRAMEILKANGAGDIALLKCISSYPADPKGFNLNSIKSLQERYQVPVGLSDHTLTDEIALGATALGAQIIEKHVILDRKSGLIDSGFSLEPHEFKRMVDSVHTLHAALGSAQIGPSEQESIERTKRRSLFIKEDLPAGTTLSMDNIAIVRPGKGLEPKYLDEVIGKRLKQDTVLGTPIHWELLEN